MSVEDLARALSLSPGTVVHHLKRLREARLVESKPRRPYVDYSLRLERLAELGRELGRMAHEQSGVEPDRRGSKLGHRRGRTGAALLLRW